MRTFLVIILMAAGSMVAVQASVQAQCKPLTIPGKKTLFQRVVSHPGAHLHQSPSVP